MYTELNARGKVNNVNNATMHQSADWYRQNPSRVGQYWYLGEYAKSSQIHQLFEDSPWWISIQVDQISRIFCDLE
jgi:hypothetical protein